MTLSKPYCIGVTGNIGSGKSTACNFLKHLGVKVISADSVSKTLTLSTGTAFPAIVQHFGTEVLLPSGELDRRCVREQIFNNPEQRVWLENLLHPLIRQAIEAALVNSNSPYCIIEIPLLLDKTHYPYLHRILLILAQQKIALNRISLRDESPQELTLAILASQPSEAVLRNLADDILVNNGTQEAFYEDIITLHARYLQYSSSQNTL